MFNGAQLAEYVENKGGHNTMHAREANDSGAATCCDDTEYLESLTEARREVLATGYRLWHA